MSDDRANATYLRRGGLLLTASALGGFVVDYAFNARLSHALEPHAFGDFRVAWAAASLLGVAVLLGGDRAAPRALAGPFERREHRRVWEYLRFYLAVSLGLSVLVIAGTWLGGVLHAGSADPMRHHAISWAVLAVPLSAAGALASRALQSARHPARANVPWRVGVPLLGLLLVSAWAAVRGRLIVQEAVALTTVGVVGIAAWQWWQLRRLEMPAFARDPTASTPRAWLGTSMPMMGVFLVALALNQSDLYFLEVLGDEREVGYYAAAATAAHFVLVLQTTIVGLVAPLAQLAFEEGPAAVRRIARQCRLLLLVVIVPAAAVLVLAARPVLSLFGESYTVATRELVLLVAGDCAWALAAFATLALQYTGRGLVVVGITLATLVLDSTLNAVLIPTHGMLGAAASTAATTLLAALAVLVARWRTSPP